MLLRITNYNINNRHNRRTSPISFKCRFDLTAAHPLLQLPSWIIRPIFVSSSISNAKSNTPPLTRNSFHCAAEYQIVAGQWSRRSSVLIRRIHKPNKLNHVLNPVCTRRLRDKICGIIICSTLCTLIKFLLTCLSRYRQLSSMWRVRRPNVSSIASYIALELSIPMSTSMLLFVAFNVYSIM